jgi:hypothetical protein
MLILLHETRMIYHSQVFNEDVKSVYGFGCKGGM